MQKLTFFSILLISTSLIAQTNYHLKIGGNEATLDSTGFQQ
jgi:hypothetical protein